MSNWLRLMLDSKIKDEWKLWYKNSISYLIKRGNETKSILDNIFKNQITILDVNYMI